MTMGCIPSFSDSARCDRPALDLSPARACRRTSSSVDRGMRRWFATTPASLHTRSLIVIIQVSFFHGSTRHHDTGHSADSNTPAADTHCSGKNPREIRRPSRQGLELTLPFRASSDQVERARSSYGRTAQAREFGPRDWSTERTSSRTDLHQSYSCFWAALRSPFCLRS